MERHPDKASPLLFAVNQQRFELSSVDPSTTLLQFLRQHTSFKSVKLSCGEGLSLSLELLHVPPNHYLGFFFSRKCWFSLFYWLIAFSFLLCLLQIKYQHIMHFNYLFLWLLYSPLPFSQFPPHGYLVHAFHTFLTTTTWSYIYPW